MVAKLAEGPLEARRGVAAGHRSEVGFYQHLAPKLAVRAPMCWYAGLADEGAQFTLLLEDLAPRRPGRQVDGRSLHEAEAAVRNLAGLHASSWNDPHLLGLDFVSPVSRPRAEFLGQLAAAATEQFIRTFEDRLGVDDPATLRDAARVLVDWQLSRPDPLSLIHGDYRLDNLMFPAHGDDVVAVDWQTASIALPARDLAYFLGTALPPDQRRRVEETMVSIYFDTITSLGVRDYSAAQCYDDYRFGHLQGPMIALIGRMMSFASGSAEADDMFISMVVRSCAAIRDLDSIGRISH